MLPMKSSDSLNSITRVTSAVPSGLLGPSCYLRTCISDALLLLPRGPQIEQYLEFAHLRPVGFTPG